MISVKKTKNAKLILKMNDQIFPGEPLDINELSHFWLLYDNDFPIGFASMRGLRLERDTVFFDRAGLKPIARGNNYQCRLINARLRYAKKLGYRRAITYCMDENLPSANNLIKCGFHLYEPAERWADSSSNKEALYFMKEL